jgi:hypothetical protein
MENSNDNATIHSKSLNPPSSNANGTLSGNDGGTGVSSSPGNYIY